MALHTHYVQWKRTRRYCAVAHKQMEDTDIPNERRPVSGDGASLLALDWQELPGIVLQISVEDCAETNKK